MDEEERIRAEQREIVKGIMAELGADKQDDVSLSGPGGWKANFNGAQGLCVAVLLGVGVLIWYLFGKNEMKVDALIDAQAQVKNEVKENTETQQVMIYVISLPQAERERLNLSKPRKLAEMQR